MSTVRLSVIVASQDAGPTLRDCIAALTGQLPPAEMEIVVADGSGRAAEVQALLRDFPAVSLVRGPLHASVPRLWSAGIAAARGDLVALTIENCIPAPGWAREMLLAHASDCSGVGGAIDIAPRCGLTDWAVYFSRYSSYMPPFAPRLLEDLPGDNCCYKRAALERVRDCMGEGFWETFIHYDMRARQERLRSDPAPVVVYQGGLSAWRFLRRRFRHGRYFAARRARRFTAGQRWMRAAGFAAVPPLLLYRTALRVWRHRRHCWKFFLALPLVAGFSMAWAAGEGLGYLTGNPGAPAAGID